MNKVLNLKIAALIILCMLPACGKKDAGCKLDSECPNGQICRNMKCEPAPASNDANQDIKKADEAKPEEQKAEDAKPADNANPEAKPTVPQQINLEAFADSKRVKLEDLGLDIDYILSDTIQLYDNTKLEIGPGVTIDMQSSSAGFRINDDTALIVNGTAESPVVFKSTNGSAWSGLSFISKNKDNSLNYLNISNADGEDSVIIATNEARLAMDHVILDGSANNGIAITGDAKFTKFTNNTIKNCKGFPLVAYSFAQLASIGDNNIFENNKQYIRIDAYTFDNIQNTIIKKLPVPYYLSDGMAADGESGTLTIEAGVELVFEHEKEARIGESIQLKLEGTPENPVIMRGINDEANFWSGFKFESTRPSTISGLTIINAGYDESPAMRIRDDANVTLSGITFKDTASICLEIGSNAKVINKGSLVFEKCDKGNIYDNRIDADEDKKVLNDLPISQE